MPQNNPIRDLERMQTEKLIALAKSYGLKDKEAAIKILRQTPAKSGQHNTAKFALAYYIHRKQSPRVRITIPKSPKRRPRRR